MKAWIWVKRASLSAKKQLEDWYSPREIRAIFLFLALGVSVLLFRSGRTLYEMYLPTHIAKARATEIVRTDSLFKALSAKASAEDSMIFSLPPDSLAPRSMRTAPPKGSMLAPGSIALNLATKEQLMQLPGVGPSIAEKILGYRNKRSKFRSLDELMNVKTIGESRYSKMKSYLRLN